MSNTREKLIELLHSGDRCLGVVGDGYGCCDCPHHSLEKPCDEFAATADMLIANGVVIPVHCKDCKYWRDDIIRDDHEMKCCSIGMYMTKADNFCSFGKRSDGE